jgi:predicted DNA-binding protein
MPDGSKRPIARNRILSVRFTESEYAALENLAWSKGTTLADWAREALGHSLGNGGSERLEMHIFTELVGIQMLLMNTLEPILRGDKMTQERLTALFRQVQTTKAAKAQELLAKRSQNRER